MPPETTATRSLAPGLPLCAGCDVPLRLSQPDPHRPSRLLGVCPECGAWWLLAFARKIRRRLVAPD